ncbi:MAG: hypothetical protein ACKVKF_21680 [Rhodobacterales bacterium]|uniref:hypothetical protein n=1 Tax=Puniceibacterium antarcticum TaxID=1206336 RepID=UPI001FEB351F|nr:hypothetical protein [Puniceibacterium antarcticum]
MQPNDARRGTGFLRQDGGIFGFATWRACHCGTKIGPIVAPHTACALDLIADIACLPASHVPADHRSA